MLNTRPGESGALNFNQLEDTAMNLVEVFCGTISRPVDLILRPWHGTRYFPVPVIFLSTLMMMFLPLFSMMTTQAISMIPFSHVPMPVGLFGIGSLAKLYFFLCFLHGIRLYRRMIFMELETNSQFEGPPLPFFYLIPKGRSFWFTRILLEPAFLLIFATTMGRMYIFQSGLVTYLELAAFALAMKNFCAWYRAWQYIRNLMDMRFAGPIIAKLAENQASEEEMASVHLASFPKGVPEDIRQSAASHIAHALSVEG